MNPNPIYKVLSTLEKHKVKALLIGGQATINYGAAEFSRDIDFAIALDEENLENIKSALKKLKANQVYFPPLKIEYLKRGHACHFKCGLTDIKGFRVDLIGKLKGCKEFDTLWKRRKVVEGPYNIKINLISLEDLVQSKKTQRDKDWLMAKRLLETDILNAKKPSNEKISWWFIECITPELLIELAKKYPAICRKHLNKRTLLKFALEKNIDELKNVLRKEEQVEREKDKKYWFPLMKELKNLRHIMLAH